MRLTINGTEHTAEKDGTFYKLSDFIDYTALEDAKEVTITADDGTAETVENPEFIYNVRNQKSGGCVLGWRVKTAEEVESDRDSAAKQAGVEAFPEWCAGMKLAKGNFLAYGGKLYKVTTAHTASESEVPGTSANFEG